MEQQKENNHVKTAQGVQRRRHAEDLLQAVFDLPSDPENSDADPDDDPEDIADEPTEEGPCTSGIGQETPSTPQTTSVNMTSEAESTDDSDEEEAADGWSSNTKQFSDVPKEFTNTGSLPANSTLTTEADFLKNLLTDEILDNIVAETNRYARQPQAKKERQKGFH